jgi:hypothetical protein
MSPEIKRTDSMMDIIPQTQKSLNRENVLKFNQKFNLESDEIQFDMYGKTKIEML